MNIPTLTFHNNAVKEWTHVINIDNFTTFSHLVSLLSAPQKRKFHKSTSHCLLWERCVCKYKPKSMSTGK